MAQPKAINQDEAKQNENFQTKQTNKSIEQSKYPQKMQEIFDYLDHTPMSIIGQKMYYKPSNQLSNNRNIIELVNKLETLDFNASNKSSCMHHARICRGLLYLSLNGIDECHNLVTPLSWPSYTSFGGQPIYNSPSQQNACYAHALTHRREGQNIGEFGSGWNNSNYWFGQTGNHKIIFPQIAKYSYDIVHGNLKKLEYQKHKKITTFLQSILRMNYNNKQEQKFLLEWKPSLFSNLCEKAVRQ
eukprot:202152_1